MEALKLVKPRHRVQKLEGALLMCSCKLTAAPEVLLVGSVHGSRVG